GRRAPSATPRTACGRRGPACRTRRTIGGPGGRCAATRRRATGATRKSAWQTQVHEGAAKILSRGRLGRGNVRVNLARCGLGQRNGAERENRNRADQSRSEFHQSAPVCTNVCIEKPRCG